ncbi:MAG TPA: ABC transporter permease [Silvibacterium sp.]|nr:ABC transporter permease [Silvibacterium sp.]
MRWWQIGKRDAEAERELRSDLELEEEEQRENGLSPEDAHYAARRAFGNTVLIREQIHEVWGWAQFECLFRDLRYALRRLLRSPGFSIATIVILAIGIGATTAIFSLVSAVLLRPLPFPEPDRLVWASQQDHSLPGIAPESLSYPDYFDWRAQNHTLEGIASYTGGAVTMKLKGESQRLDVEAISANFFDVLGIAPLLGRDFRWDDEKPGNHVVMLSYSFWQSQFGSAKDIIGRPIRMNDHDYIVAGVMPKEFQFPVRNPAPVLWMSLADDAEGKSPPSQQRGFDVLRVVGRLRPGVTIAQAKADLSVIAANLARQYPDSNKHYTSALVEPELTHMIGDTRPVLRVLFGAVSLVLLLVCANVAGLLLARGSRRSAEMAVRAAIGASRAAIIRQLLLESLVLSVCGGLAGIALAYGLIRGMLKLMPLEIPRMQGASLDGGVLVFVLVTSLVTGLIFGAFPAWRLSRAAPARALGEGSRTVSSSKGQLRLHNILVVAQTAVCMVLLVGSGLLIRSFLRILDVDPGFDAKHVLTSRLVVSFNQMKHDQHYLFYQQLLARISGLPGVKSASAGWPLPMSDGFATISFNIVGRSIAVGDEPNELMGVVMPGYFKTMRIPLIAGRAFGEEDGLKGPPAIIINQAFAKKYFPGENPIGRHIQTRLGDGVFEESVREVVGVVGNIKSMGLTANADPQYYLPYAQAVVTNPYVVIRTNGDPAAMQGAIRSSIHALDPNVPIYQVETMENYLSKSAAQPRFQAFLLTCFAGIALVLAAIGLYGLLSYVVAQRTFEIGLRMALGAKRSDVLGMIVRRGFVLTLAGLGAGMAISAVLTQFISGMLFHVRPIDPLTFAGTAALLLLVSAAASIVPGCRAAYLDPMKTLHEQ